MSSELIKKETVETAYKKVKKIIDLNALKFIDGFPNTCTDDSGKYSKSHGKNMSDGFWTGIFILAYEISEDTKYLYATTKYVEQLYERLFEGDTYFAEIGLLYVPSCAAASQIGKNNIAKTAVVVAADILTSIYKKVNHIYYVNDNYLAPDKDHYVPMKISAMLNCSVLYWAYEFNRAESYKKLANDVIGFIADNLIAEDGTVYWEYDLKKGAVVECFVHGYNCRGIAWALYGLAVRMRQKFDGYIYKKILSILEKYVPQIKNAEICSMDSTMLACIVCALYNISNCVNEGFEQYLDFADWLLLNLIEKASLQPLGKTDGLIGYSNGMNVYKTPMKNVSSVIGDYFYMEALVYKIKKFKLIM